MGKSKSFLFLILFYCLLPLFGGALVYLFFRTGHFTNAPKISVEQPLLKQLFFTLPDFCWSYSFAFALYLFSAYYYFRFKRSVVLIFLLLVISEVVQLMFPKYFTFDIFDLFAAAVAFVLSMLQIKKIAYEKKI